MKTTKPIKNRKLVNYNMLLSVFDVVVNGAKVIEFKNSEDVYVRIFTRKASTLSAVLIRDPDTKLVHLEAGDAIVISKITKYSKFELDMSYPDSVDQLGYSRTLINNNGTLMQVPSLSDSYKSVPAIDMGVIHRKLIAKFCNGDSKLTKSENELMVDHEIEADTSGVKAEYDPKKAVLNITIGNDVTGLFQVDKQGEIMYDCEHGVYLPLEIRKDLLELVDELHVARTGKPLPVQQPKEDRSSGRITAMRLALLAAERKNAKLIPTNNMGEGEASDADNVEPTPDNKNEA